MPGASVAPVAARKPLFRFLAPYALWHPTPFIHPRCSGYEAVNISDGPFSLCRPTYTVLHARDPDCVLSVAEPSMGSDPEPPSNLEIGLTPKAL